ncbi:dienelactone hydrolase family protein [Arthrobacter sp. NPDC080073]|uniref:dienelactone hydrolase family protein n=1 Tax=Arthrobacter sp. NPDC080073 TaxID=3155919 RepID=UPI0034185140
MHRARIRSELSQGEYPSRDSFQEMAQSIADWGYVVLAPNVFYREGSVAELAPAVDISAQEGREAAGQAAFPRVGRLTPERRCRTSMHDQCVGVRACRPHRHVPRGRCVE